MSRDTVDVSWVVTVALFAPFALVATVVAYTAQGERMRRATEGRVLRDYGVIAASALAGVVNQELHSQVALLLQPAVTVHAEGRQAMRNGARAEPASLLRHPLSGVSSVMLPHALGAFRLELPSGRSVSAGSISPDALRRLSERAETVVADDGDPHRVFTDTMTDVPVVVALQYFRENAAQSTVMYAIVTDARALVAVVQKVLDERDVVPSELFRPPHGPDQLRVAVASPDGGVSWANAAVDRTSAAWDSLPTFLGGFRVYVESGSAIAKALSIGRPSPLYVPTLVALLLLSAALAVLAASQLRRRRALEALRTQFVANVSHELRTPLTQISMFAEMLSLGRNRDHAEQRRYALVIHRETRRLAALVENVLGVARAQEGRTALRCEPRHLASELRDAVEAFALIARSADVEVTVHAPSDLWVNVDPGAFRQIILNVLDNAVKYGPRGQVVRITASSTLEGACIAVTDEGPGIPYDQRERVFALYARVERTGAPNVAGTGIGLAVVAERVRAHGGRVRIADAACGTCIEILLPLTAS